MEPQKQIEDQINRKTHSTLIIREIKQESLRKPGQTTQEVSQQILSVVTLTEIRILFIHGANIVHRGTYNNPNLAIYIKFMSNKVA